jgi:hypothetical protein
VCGRTDWSKSELIDFGNPPRLLAIFETGSSVAVARRSSARATCLPAADRKEVLMKNAKAKTQTAKAAVARPRTPKVRPTKPAKMAHRPKPQ